MSGKACRRHRQSWSMLRAGIKTPLARRGRRSGERLPRMHMFTCLSCLLYKNGLTWGRGAPAEDICTDSLYARNVTLGVYRGRKGRHAAMIRNLRQIWKATQIIRGRDMVRIVHVRSHIGVPGNEAADAAATAGMKNANEVKAARETNRPPRLVNIDLEWARAQMRAITRSSRLPPHLHPPQTPKPPTPPYTLDMARRIVHAACHAHGPQRSTRCDPYRSGWRCLLYC